MYTEAVCIDYLEKRVEQVPTDKALIFPDSFVFE